MMNKTHVVKNVVVMCVGVFLFLISTQGLTMLQSSMNSVKNIGVISQAVNNGSFFLSSLFLSNFIIEKLGSKTTFILSLLSMVPFTAANYYPQWIVMILTSVLYGLGTPLFLISQSNYLNNISDIYSELCSTSESISPTQDSSNGLEQKPVKTVVAVEQSPEYSQKISPSYDTFKQGDLTNKNYFIVFKNGCELKRSHEMPPEFHSDNQKRKYEANQAKIFGIHGMAIFCSDILGNLMSFLILSKTVMDNEKLRNKDRMCGAYFCNSQSNFTNDTIQEVSYEARKILITVCLTIGVLSVLFLVFVLDPLKTKSVKSSSSVQLLIATVKFLKNKKSALLTPAVITIGLTNVFYTADFTQAYINCSLGIHNVSLVSVSYAVFSALSAFSSGWMNDIFGRKVVITLATFVNIASCVILLLWVPDPNHPQMYFIIAGIIGVYNGIISAQLKAFYGRLFREDENMAFAAFHLWYSLSMCVSYAYSGYLCTYIKLYIILILSVIGYAGYFIVDKK